MSRCSTFEPVPRDVGRPWFWWVAVGIIAALFGIEAWLVYRVFAGWPVADLFWLQKLAAG